VDGAVSPDGSVMGSYLHGLFDHPQAGGALLQWAGMHHANGVDLSILRDNSLNRLAASSQTLLDALQRLPRWRGAQRGQP